MGDTNVLLETARKMVANATEEILFLSVGQAAKAALEKLPAEDVLRKSKAVRIVSLADILGDDVMKLLENKALDASQLLKVKKDFLERNKISKTLIGTPSQLNALAPFQIAEVVSALLNQQQGFIFNDYFYKEPAHAYWKELERKVSANDWRQHFTWLVPLPATKEKIIAVNQSVTVDVVGHPAIDAAMDQKPLPVETINAYRKSLAIDDKQSFIFISGTKDLNDDKALLEELLKALVKQDKQDVQIRLGLHPGNQDLNQYITGLLAVIQSAQYSKVSAQVKFIVPDTLVARIQPELLKSSYLLRANVNGDQSAAAAHGVASAVPATLVNQTAMSGRPAYYHQEKESYLPKDRLYVGKQNLDAFFNIVKARTHKNPLSKAELGLSDNAAGIITQRILAK